MVGTKRIGPSLVSVTVELFGTARVTSGLRQVEILVPERLTRAELAAALAEVCPELTGKVLEEDLSGLQESYTFNLNGTDFMSDGPLHLKSGDSLLLFSSQAGG